MENDELLHKWVNGDLTTEEQEVFKRRPEYEALKKLKAQTDQMAVPAFDEEGMLKGILAADKQAIDGRRRFLLPTWSKYVAAAAVLLLLGLFFWPSPELARFQTAGGEQLDGYLPDGSTFVLNAESSLTYDPATWDAKRTLHLEGEAFFTVEKGEPFSVNTLNGEIVVLGTAFNVWSRNQTLEVKCQSGKVSVFTKESPQQNELTANDAIRYTAGQMIEKWVEPASNTSSWREGVSRFRKVPLATVLAELERQYDINIQSGTVDTQAIVSCNFIHSDLKVALKTCLQPLSIGYVIEGNIIVLSKE